MGKLDFSIAINLLTDNFKRGANEVKSAFSSMQAKFLTFAAALQVGDLSIGGFFSSLIDIARKSNEATIALQNVSRGAQQYANDQRFLIDLAKKYGIEINGLTLQYARFTSAANVQGMTVANQHKVFSSVSRAVAAFSLSSENAQRVFMALERMVSTNTINSKELRMEMGMQLPVAMEAMAMATGKSVEQMEKMMKSGKLLAKDILPKFADALNKLIPNVNTNHLETSLNRLANAKTAFTLNAGVQDKYKSFIDWLTNAITYVGNNIKTVTTEVVAFLIGSGLGKFFKWFANQLAISQRNAMYAARKAAREAGVQFDAVKWKAESGASTIGAAFERAGNVIKKAFMSALPTIILVIISEIIGRLAQLREEAEQIKNIQKEYKNGLFQATHTQEIEQLKTIQQQYNAAKSNLELQIKYRAQINNLLGTHLTTEKDINKAISDRIGLLEKTAKAEYYTQSKISAEDEMNQIVAKYGGAKNYNKLLSIVHTFSNTNNPSLGGTINRFGVSIDNKGRIKGGLSGLFGSGVNVNDFINDKNRYNALAWKRGDASKNVNKLGFIPSQYPTLNNTPSGTKKTKETDFEKIEDNYYSSLRDLTERAKIEKTSKNEYNKQLDELNKSTYLNIVSSGDTAAKNSAFAATLKKAAYNPRFSQAQEDYEKAQKDYDDGLNKLGIQLAEGYITQQGYDDSVRELQKKVVDEISGTEGLNEAQKSFVKTLQREATPKMSDVMAKITPQDTTENYKKSDLEINQDNLDYVQKKLETLKKEFDDNKNAARDFLTDLQKEITATQGEVTYFQNAVKLQSLKDDIKDYQQQLGLLDGNYEIGKNVVNGLENIYNTWGNLNKSLKNESGFQSLLTVLDSITSTIDSIKNVIDTINRVVGIIHQLTGAEQKERLIEQAANAQKITNAGTSAAAQVAALGTITIAENTAAEAATVQMAAESTAAYAAIPFVGEGLAAAQITSMKALIAASALPAFATGGIVGGGSTSGDNVLARLNSGEMVLNMGQQSKLFGIINSGAIGGGKEITSTITHTIKGSEMILTINNRLREKGKKTL